MILIGVVTPNHSSETSARGELHLCVHKLHNYKTFIDHFHKYAILKCEGGRLAKKFRKSQIRKFADLYFVKYLRTFRKLVAICRVVNCGPHCKKSWRSSSTPASGDAGPIHTGIEKSFRQPRRKFYYKYRIFSAFFTSAELVRYDSISHVELFRWWPSNLLFTNVKLVRQSW